MTDSNNLGDTTGSTTGQANKGLAKGMTKLKAAEWFAILGALSLLYCAWNTIKDPPVEDSSNKICNPKPLKGGEVKESDSDKTGMLRIVEVYPSTTEINNHNYLCAIVAGVVNQKDETEVAVEGARLDNELVKARDDLMNASDEKGKREAAERLQQARSNRKALQPLAPVKLTIFMNGQVSPFTVEVEPIHGPQILRFPLEVPEDVDHKSTAFWRELLQGVIIGGGKKLVTLGLSRSATVTTIPDDVSTKPFTLLVFTPWTLVPGALALLFFAVSFILYARRTTLLRDNDWTVNTRTKFLTQEEARAKTEVTNRETEANNANSKLTQNPQDTTAMEAKQAADVALAEAKKNATNATNALSAWNTEKTKRGLTEDDTPIGPYSLGRTQMAFWFFLVIVGFIYISMSLGQYQHLITGDILVLLGISGVTGLASIQITGDKATDRTTRHFLRDILGNDAGEPQLQRIQSVAWTIVLGAIFVWLACRDFRFATFDTNLLLLMGIAQSFYIGFKFQEESKPPSGK